jgi:formylglycine-generating enzyme required for sulfatase activity
MPDRCRTIVAMHVIGLSVAVAVYGQDLRRRTNPIDGLASIWIPAGSYSMGCSEGDRECFTWEDKLHTERIATGFWINETEVTQEAYRRVTGKNPSRYRGPNLPADQITWNAAGKYCAAVGMRLPREYEWEYAARGGSNRRRYGALETVAWFDGNSGDSTRPVAAKKPNAFGLYDTLGNVWEWVDDAYGKRPDKRILRGGSFLNLARDLRVSNRLWAYPETDHRNMGFRCAAD